MTSSPTIAEVRAKVRRNQRAHKAKCAKHADALNLVLDQVFQHGPIEQDRVSQEALKHPEFQYLLEEFEHAGVSFYDLSNLGRYHMTGEHAAIDEKPWRPVSKLEPGHGG